MPLHPVLELKKRLTKQSLRQLGNEFGFSAAYLGDVSRGRRPASEKLIDALGLEVCYRRKRPSSNGHDARP